MEVSLGLFDRLWLGLRSNNTTYMLNKLLSVTIAFSFAFYTLSFKRLYYQYSIDYPDAQNLWEYALLYWLLFIYSSFLGIDQLIEMYSVFFKREKGALGLLFEMNYFLGVAIAVGILWFVNQPWAVITDEKYVSLYNYIIFQKMLFYGSCIFSFVLMFFFCIINGHARTSKVAKDDFKQA